MTLMTRDSWHNPSLTLATRDNIMPSEPRTRFSRFPFRDDSFPHLTPYSSWFDQRFFEMEKRFAEFIKSTDQRFTGILGVIDVNSDSSYPIPVIHEDNKETNKIMKKQENGKYKIEINVQDFKPEEVTVHVSNGKVEVQAKRETKNEDVGMFAHTYREFRRNFKLPDGIETEKVTSSLTDDGVLMIEAIHSSAPAIAAIPIPVVHEN